MLRFKSGYRKEFATPDLGIKFSNIMGHYKGRVNLRRRKKRFVKDQRIKALGTAKKGNAPPSDTAEQGNTAQTTP